MSKRVLLVVAVLLALGATSVGAQVDTIIHDDGVIVFPWPFDTLAYYAVRFTPTGRCSVRAGLTWIQPASGPAECSLFVWNNGPGNLPGAVVAGPIRFFPQTLTWNYTGLSTSYIDLDDFWIGYCTPFVPMAGYCYAMSDAITDSPPPGRDYVSWDGTNWWSCRDSIPGWMGNLGIRVEVEYLPFVHDVGTDAVLEPPDTVSCGNTVLVAATVCNYGDTAETFDVEAIIDSFGVAVYGDTVTVAGLDSANCDTANFTNWIVPPVHGVPYTVTVTTLLSPDADPTNDVGAKGALAWCPVALHDVGTASVDEPPDTVSCGDTVLVAATVCNWGDTVETFDVEAIIDSGGPPLVYADTVTVASLDSAHCDTANFADWIVPVAHDVSYTVRVATLLAGDDSTQNDTLSKGALSWCPVIHDVGTDAVLEPPDTVACEDTVLVVARVCNYGDSVETFNVEARIDSSGFDVYLEMQTVVGLDPGDCDTVTFPDWSVPSVHGVSYTVTVTTRLGPDIDPTNDTATKGALAWCPAHDVGTASVDEPPDTVACDSTFPVAATVCNYGDMAETFDVEAIIDSSGVGVYADTQTVTNLNVGDCDTVNFANWSVPPVHGISYAVTVTTMLPTDINGANDAATKGAIAWCPSHDVGTASVDQPPDTVACDDTVSVVATVCNYGDSAETFDVEAIIDSSGVEVYGDTVTMTDLPPDSCWPVNFADWPVPPIHGVSYTVTVTTMLGTDIDPTNDAATKGAVGWCPSRDVGTASVDEPPDTVSCGDTVLVAATVCNYGDSVETFDVEAIIDSSGAGVYSDTVTVMDLDPGMCDTASFADWVVPPVHGVSYTVTVTTMLGTDVNPANDARSKGAIAWCPSHDVGTASVDEPPDTVSCGDSVGVAATVCNYGDVVETFDVEAIIDSSGVGVYADTQTVTNLDFGDCDTVNFADWPVPPVHGVSYTVTVTTMLATDTDPTNDEATKGAVGWCPVVQEIVTIPQAPSTYSLGQSRPNPAIGWARIDYRLVAASKVCLRVYDLKGTVVRTLVEGVEEAGSKTVVWDGRDDRGNQTASGIYFWSLRALPEPGANAGRFTAIRKLILLR